MFFTCLEDKSYVIWEYLTRVIFFNRFLSLPVTIVFDYGFVYFPDNLRFGFAAEFDVVFDHLSFFHNYVFQIVSDDPRFNCKNECKSWVSCCITRQRRFPKNVLPNLDLAMIGLVGSLHSPGPALFTALILNSYWVPSFKPSTVPEVMSPSIIFPLTQSFPNFSYIGRNTFACVI